MKTVFTLIASLSSFILLSQSVVYEDHFDDGILSVGGDPTGYMMTLSDGTMQIVGTGAAGPWTAMSYEMHDGTGSPILVDASESPKLYIRAKGENSPSLRIDLQDEAGYVTNLDPIEITLDDDYSIYEYDYTGRLADGAYGGTPCTSAPCPLDESKVRGVIIFVNAANGGYAGTIDIDWISVGAPPGGDGFVQYDIRYNQVTYLTGRDKLISIASRSEFSDIAYAIYEEDAAGVIMEGQVSSEGLWSASQEYIGTIDVSDIDVPGLYRLETDQQTISFNVSADGYNELCQASLKYYYYNRASQELTPEFAGPWARPLGHPDEEVIVHFSAASESRPTGTIISSPKGWYDAGDYNKYIVNSGISTYTLLAAYEHYPEYYDNLGVPIPEQGGDLPDLLDEITWNLDWMLTMQDPADGGVYHKLTGLNFSGIVMPHEYNFDRYVVQKSTSAALNLAAVAAVASRVFEKFEDVRPGYSAELLEAARRAYVWAEDNPREYYNQPSNVSTGQYGDNNVSDEFAWAASELFITTGESSYREDITESQIGNGVPSWQYTAPLALVSLVANAESVASSMNMAVIENKLLSTANQLRSAVNNSVMQVAMGASNSDFVWGSNGQAGNQILLLLRAYELTRDESFLESAYLAMDYLLGRNGTGYCYVSGFGDQSPRRPHHRQSEADDVTEPVPGMVAGGPNPGRQDGCPGYIASSPAGSYVDSWCSYASNEVTINWNAPMAYCINALQYYQSGLPTATDELTRVEIEPLEVFPNPGNNMIYISQIDGSQDMDIEIVNKFGQVIYLKRSVRSQQLDLSDLEGGIYMIRLIAGEKISVAKWVKDR